MTDAATQSMPPLTNSQSLETARLAALHRYNILDTPPETAFDRITALAARLFQVPIAIVSLMDTSRAWFKSCYGWDQQEVPRHQSICNAALQYSEVLVIPDTLQDSRFSNQPYVQGEPGVRFFASAPLLNPEGFNLGALCLVDTQPRTALSQEQQAMLRDLAALVVDELELRLALANQRAAEQEHQAIAASQQATQQRLQLYADVVRNTQIGIVVWQLEDPQDPGSFRLLISNPAASEATGFEFEPLIGQTMADCFPALVQTPLLQTYLEVVRSGRSQDLGEVAYSADGIATGIYTLKAFPLPLNCLGLAFENITVRKQMEAQLQESQRYNQQIAEAMPGVLFVHDLIQQQNVYTNRQISDLLGYTPEQIQAMGANAIAYLVHPEDLAATSKYFGSFHGIQDDTVVGIEYRARHASGEWRWLYTRSIVFKRTITGSPGQILGVSIDISDRKQSETALQHHSERLRLLYETTRALLSAKQPLDLMNQLFEQLSTQLDLHYYYHFQVVTEAGHSHLQLRHYSGISLEQARTLDRLEIGQALCGLVAQEQRQRVFNQAELAVHPNAQAVCALGVTAYAGQPLIVQGRLIGTLSFASLTRCEFTVEETSLLQAISEQVAIALDRADLVSSLQQQTEDLRQANRVKDEFLAVLSHELRSPLNPILGWTKLLQTAHFNPQQQQQALEIIERNVKLQTQLIDDLLDISRILQGKLVLREAPVPLQFALESALETVRLAAEAKEIQIHTHLPPSLAPVLGDAGRLQQVIWNLLSNAIKFTPAGGQVTVDLAQVGSEAVLQITDTGKGIAPNFLPYVFESFRQEDGRTTRKFGGLGLGLAIVRQLTELHGGRVMASSPGEDQGATFTLRLPLMQPMDHSISGQALESGPATTDTLRDLRVLVVDDEADMRDLAGVILEQAGAIVQLASSAAVALNTVEQFRPHLIISDIGMPEMDGFEFLRQLRSRPDPVAASIPAIALTAYAMDQDQQQALQVGFQHHLAKPIEPDDLIQAIATLIRQESPRSC